MKPARWSACVILVCVVVGAGTILRSAEPAPAPIKADFGEAVLRHWIQPEYPEAARKAKLSGQVLVDFVVEADGQVSRPEIETSTNDIFNEAALAAVRQWGFDAALEDAKPAASAMRAPIIFRFSSPPAKPGSAPPADLDLQTLPVTPAKFKEAPDPDYPVELGNKKLPGEVLIEFIVDAGGKARTPKIIWASHAAFVEMALRSLEQTVFEPAHQGPLPRPSKMKYPVEFQIAGATRPDILAANHISLADEAGGSVTPMPFVLPDPVYPIEHLLAGEEGAAVGEFDVDEHGRTKGVTLISATAPEFGAALLAAIETWMFRPAAEGNTVDPVRLRVSYAFSPPGDGPVARLVGVLQPGGGGVGPAAGLDQKLKALWRGFPVYPYELREDQVKGSAEIEVIVDREGRVRLPKVKSATRPEFGWAAAEAISQWIFDRPTRKGEPVDLTVTVPVNFVPPKQ